MNGTNSSSCLVFCVEVRAISQRMKGKVYKICLGSAMYYKAKSCAMRVEDINGLETTEMIML